MATTAQPSVASSVLERWYAAWNVHDVDAIGALMTGDVRYEDPAADSDVLEGRQAVTEYVRAAFRGLPDLHLEKLEEWPTPGDAVIASYFRITATFTGALETPGMPSLAPTNGPIDLLGMDRSEIHDRLIARHQIFWDTGALGRQLGAYPARGSAGDRLSRRLQHLTARRLRRQG